MAILKFRGIYLEDFEQLEVKDPDTRYLVLNPDGSVYGEYIGDKLIGTAERIKQLYEENPDTNAFTDAEKIKLAGIEEGAQVNTVSPEDLVADNISFDGSGTNYLVGEADVEGAIKELDTRVKSNADNVALKVNISDIVDDLVSTATDKPLSANQGKVLNDITAKLAVSNVFTQPQVVPDATLAQHAVNRRQVERMFDEFEQQLPGYNLAMPNLANAVDLGGGIYRLRTVNGGTLTYNVNTGEYRLFGNLTGDFTYVLGTKPVGNYYIQIWKTEEVVFDSGEILFGYYGTGARHVKITPTRDYEGKVPEYVADTWILTYQVRGEIDVSFKVKLEKGNSATPYTMPGETPRYYDILALRPQEAWITPTMLNGWVNSGSPNATLQYMKDTLGFVHIKGAIRNGTGGTVMVLPVGYRPSENRRYMGVVNDNEWVFVEVTTVGALYVNLTNQPNKVIYFNISFRVEDGV